MNIDSVAISLANYVGKENVKKLIVKSMLSILD